MNDLLNHLKMDARDVILAALEAFGAGLLATVGTGNITKGAVAAAGVLALRAAVGALANLRASSSTPTTTTPSA